jgi:hypothetical protein
LLSDSDQDGMPDLWEILHGLNPNDPGDALEDPDCDGYSISAQRFYNVVTPPIP